MLSPYPGLRWGGGSRLICQRRQIRYCLWPSQSWSTLSESLKLSPKCFSFCFCWDLKHLNNLWKINFAWKERCWFLILFLIFASFLQNIGSPYFNFNSKDLDNFILSMDAGECILLISVLFLRVFYHFEVPIKSVKWQSLKKKIVKLNSLSISQLYSSHFHSASEFWRNPLNVKLLNRVDYFRRTKTLFQIIMHFYAPVSNYLRYHLEPQISI